MNYLPVPIDLSHSTFGYNYFSSAIKPSTSFNWYKLRSARLWVPKMPSESFRPVFQQILERKVFHVWEEGLGVFIRYFVTVD